MKKKKNMQITKKYCQLINTKMATTNLSPDESIVIWRSWVEQKENLTIGDYDRIFGGVEINIKD